VIVNEEEQLEQQLAVQQLDGSDGRRVDGEYRVQRCTPCETTKNNIWRKTIFEYDFDERA
jgi:hypothetical protein